MNPVALPDQAVVAFCAGLGSWDSHHRWWICEDRDGVVGIRGTRIRRILGGGEARSFGSPQGGIWAGTITNGGQVLELHRRWARVLMVEPDGVVMYRNDDPSLRGIVAPGASSITWTSTQADLWVEDQSGTGCQATLSGSRIDLPCSGGSLDAPEGTGLAWVSGSTERVGWMVVERDETNQTYLHELRSGHAFGDWIELVGAVRRLETKSWVVDAFRVRGGVCVCWAEFEGPTRTSCFTDEHEGRE